ncbi:MAG: hypothetical protein ACYTGK_18715, partial [Planctomycetota bacterium]
ESAFSGLWAQLLVRGFGRRRLRVQQLQRVWQRVIAKTPLPWYLEAKVPQGAHAAFVGLSIHESKRVSETPQKAPLAAHAATAPGAAPATDTDDDDPGDTDAHWLDPAPAVLLPAQCGAEEAAAPQTATTGHWRALAIGDTCLFHVRGEELVEVGPLQKSDEFDSRPVLLASRGPQQLAGSDTHVRMLGGTWQSQDTFYLVTDALAKWILEQHETGVSPWQVLRELGTDAEEVAFERLVADLRSSKALHNDDTTLLRVEVD